MSSKAKTPTQQTPDYNHANYHSPDSGEGYPVASSRPPRPARRYSRTSLRRAALMPPIGGFHHDAQEVVSSPHSEPLAAIAAKACSQGPPSSDLGAGACYAGAKPGGVSSAVNDKPRGAAPGAEGPRPRPAIIGGACRQPHRA